MPRATARHRRAEIYKKIFLSGLVLQYDSGTLPSDAFFKAAQAALDIRTDIDLFARLWSDIFTLINGIQPLIERLTAAFPAYMPV